MIILYSILGFFVFSMILIGYCLATAPLMDDEGNLLDDKGNIINKKGEIIKPGEEIKKWLEEKYKSNK